ncbi:MAG: DUF1801 domain-containing protein [Proteobacteria bacterium]|nr:DUF1801 domain-containing protein [Pseudomonadota bacterium]
MVNQLFRFPEAVRKDPAVTQWMAEHSNDLGLIAQYWFEVIRSCGVDVHELMHDGCPTGCVTDAAFADVNAFTNHTNVGFFRGAELTDEAGLLEGNGKYMRHVKIKRGHEIDEIALRNLIESAYLDMRRRVEAENANRDG